MRKTNNKIEKIGIDLTYQKIKDSSLIILVVDTNNYNTKDLVKQLIDLKKYKKKIILTFNKYDLIEQNIDNIELLNSKFLCHLENLKNDELNLNNINMINISSKTGYNISKLKNLIYEINIDKNFSKYIIINNSRHYYNFKKSLNALLNTKKAIHNKLTTELLIQEIKIAITSLGEITGEEITNEDILDSIFTKFCIGK